MLREIRAVSQDEPGIFRQWFTDNEYWDLYVWTAENKNIIGFQLCYNKDFDEKALTWIKGKEFSHKTVNPGDIDSNSNRRGTPILVPDGYFNKESIRERFLRDAGKIESHIRDLVAKKILEFENSNADLK